jgi:hypothetical protein
MTRRSLSEGDVISYPYRWRRELLLGTAIDGSKDRPCCLVLAFTTQDGEDVIYLAAISSKAPHPDRAAITVPDIERRRAGLTRYPEAWIYVDEVNRDVPARSWYLEPQERMGAFSKSFLARISAELRQRRRDIKVIRRR